MIPGKKLVILLHVLSRSAQWKVNDVWFAVYHGCMKSVEQLQLWQLKWSFYNIIHWLIEIHGFHGIQGLSFYWIAAERAKIKVNDPPPRPPIDRKFSWRFCDWRLDQLCSSDQEVESWYSLPGAVNCIWPRLSGITKKLKQSKNMNTWLNVSVIITYEDGKKCFQNNGAWRRGLFLYSNLPPEGDQDTLASLFSAFISSIFR